MTVLTLDCIIRAQFRNLKGVFIMKETVRRILAEKWSDYADARDCGEKSLAQEYMHDFLTVVEVYEELFNEEVYGTDSGLKYEPKG